MELDQLVRVLLKWWWLIVATVLVASVTSYLGTRALPPTYTSRTTLMVGQALQSPNPSESEFSTGQVLAQSYADLARREPVLRATLETLELEWDWTTLKDKVSSRAVPGTSLVEIVVTDTDPERARALADEITNQLILQSPAGTDSQKGAESQFVLNQMRGLQTNIKKGQQEIRDLDNVIAKATSTRQIQDARSRQAGIQTQLSNWQATYARLGAVLQQGAPNSLRVVEAAMTPQPISPRTPFNVTIAVAIGLVLSVGAALLLEFFDDSLRTSDDVRRVLNLTALGSIPRIEGDDYPDQLIMVTYPRSPTAEAFRMLRTSLQSSARTRSLRTLILTSPNPEEGKSLIAANLATALAQSGKRVILVDADLRRPVQHKVFELNNQGGLSTVLTDDSVSVDDVLQTVPTENLGILTSGPLPEDPSELLGSKRMLQLIELLQQRADVVIFDSPPVMVVGDATILAPQMDSTLLVIDSGKTRQATAQRCKEALEAVKASLSGVVLNRLATRVGGYYYYYTESGQRHGRRARQPVPRLRQVAPGPERAAPSIRSGKLSEAQPYVAQLKPIDRPAQPPSPKSSRITPPPESKPLPLAKLRTQELVAPPIEQVAPGIAASRPKISAPANAVRVQSAHSSTVSPTIPKPAGSKVGRMVRRHSLSLALLGAGAGVIVIAVFALSLTRRQNLAGNIALTRTAVAAQTTANASVSADVAAPVVALAAKETDLAQRQTEDAQARSAAATGTAAVGATATQYAINASAAQQAIGFLNCETVDFEVLESPDDITSVTSGVATIEVRWRVRNRASLPYCQWGQERQETRLIRAIEVSRQLDASTPVTLKWIDEDEYELSLKAQLGIGKYDLRWRLVLPKTNLPGGQELKARVVVVAATPTRAPTSTPVPAPIATHTPTPTSTPCPEIVYQCNCRKECSGRTCTTVCDECTRQECNQPTP
jgi:non-specific protein-tyrosine kinase